MNSQPYRQPPCAQTAKLWRASAPRRLQEEPKTQDQALKKKREKDLFKKYPAGFGCAELGRVSGGEPFVQRCPPGAICMRRTALGSCSAGHHGPEPKPSSWLWRVRIGPFAVGADDCKCKTSDDESCVVAYSSQEFSCYENLPSCRHFQVSC